MTQELYKDDLRDFTLKNETKKIFLPSPIRKSADSFLNTIETERIIIIDAAGIAIRKALKDDEAKKSDDNQSRIEEVD